MIARHTFMIHAECPFVTHKQWDYYKVLIQTEDVVDVHYLEKVMDSVRGARLSQEDIAQVIRQQMTCEAYIQISGRHSQNSFTLSLIHI